MEWRSRRLAACALLLPAVVHAASGTPTVQWAAESTYTQCSKGTIGLSLSDTLKQKRNNGTQIQRRWSIRVYNVGVPQDRGAVAPKITASTPPSSLDAAAALPLKTTSPPKPITTISSTTSSSSSPSPSSSSTLNSTSSTETSWSTEEDWSTTEEWTEDLPDPSSTWDPDSWSSEAPPETSVQPSTSSSATPSRAVHKLPNSRPTSTTPAPQPKPTTTKQQQNPAPAPAPAPTTNNPPPAPAPTTSEKPWELNGYGGLSVGEHGIGHSGGLGLEVGGKTYGIDVGSGLNWKRRLEAKAPPQMANINKTVIEDFSGDSYNWTVNVPTGNYRLAAYDHLNGIWSKSNIFTVVNGGTSCMTAADWGDLGTPGLSIGAIVGLVVGIIVGLSIIGGVFYGFRRRRRSRDRNNHGHGQGDFWRVQSYQSGESFGNIRSFRSRRSRDGGGGFSWEGNASMPAQYELTKKKSAYYMGNSPETQHAVRPSLPDLPVPTPRADSPWDTDTATSDRHFSKDLSVHTGTSHWPPASISSANRSFMGGAALQPTLTGMTGMTGMTGHSIAATAGSFKDRAAPFVDSRAGVHSVAMSAISSMAVAGDRGPPVYPVSPDNTGDTVDQLDVPPASYGYSHMERSSRPENPAWVPRSPSASACNRPDDDIVPVPEPEPTSSGPRHLAGTQASPTRPLNIVRRVDGGRSREALPISQGPSRNAPKPAAADPGHARESSEGSAETTSTTTAHINQTMNKLQQQQRNDSNDEIARNFPNTYSFLEHPYTMPNAPGDRVSNPLSQMWSPSDGGHSDWSHWGRRTDEG